MSVRQIGLQVCFLTLLLSFNIGNTVYAQQSVSGTVTDGQTGETLPGVNIKVQGTTVGTSTDSQGQYEITVPSLQDTLVFSFVGYQKQQISINGRTSIDVTMRVQAISGEEMVVVGYGTQKKSDLTGAVTTANADQINETPTSNPASALQGKLPGLQVVQGSGEPGNEEISLRIRGQGTFSGAGNDPLVIVDGLPGSLSNLNPMDIADVTVLKDAASAAIYGSRAANGVILVTTKKGRSNEFQLEYNYSLDINTPTRMLDLITNSAEYMRLFNQGLERNGTPPAYSQEAIDSYTNATDRERYPNTNWLDVMFNPAYVQNHYLSMSGGIDQTTYKVSLGYIDQPGTLKGFNFEKYTLGFNLNSKINDAISFGSNINLNYSNKLAPRQGADDTFLATLTQAPMYKPILQDGSGRYTNAAYPSIYHNKNPYAIAENVQAHDETYYIQGNIYLNVNLLKNLTWQTRGGINFDYFRRNDFRPEIPLYNWFTEDFTTNLDVGGLGLSMNTNNSFHPTIYSQFTYKDDIADHSFKILAGGQQEYFRGENLSGFRRNFPNNDLHQLDAGGSDGQSTGGSAYEWALQSLYGRLNYSFKDKYLFEANVRYDGSSRFASGNRWGLFPSFSAGWRISEESFLSNVIWLSDLKLRGSWGRLGNQEIGNYPYQQTLSLGYGYPFDYTSLSAGARPTGLINRNITWETTEAIDFGIDVSVLDNKFNFTADWFKKNTSDILRQAQIPDYVGLGAPTINNGEMENTGWEFSANYQNLIGDFGYQIGGNFQTFNNELVTYGARSIATPRIFEEGKPYGQYYLYDWIGVFQSEEEVANSPEQPYSPKPGDLKFRDINNDGVINADDRTYFDGAFPDFTYTFNLSATYKNFDLKALFYGVVGRKYYIRGWGVEPFTQSTAPTTEWRNAWTPENHTNDLPAIYAASGGTSNPNGLYPAIQDMPSTFFLKDGSYLRMQNLTIGYNLPKHVLSKIPGLSGMRITFTGQNLFTITDYPGLDPERTDDAGIFGQVQYPLNKIYSFGVNLKF